MRSGLWIAGRSEVVEASGRGDHVVHGGDIGAADTVPSNGHRGRARALTGLTSQLGDVGVLHAD